MIQGWSELAFHVQEECTARCFRDIYKKGLRATDQSLHIWLQPLVLKRILLFNTGQSHMHINVHYMYVYSAYYTISKSSLSMDCFHWTHRFLPMKDVSSLWGNTKTLFCWSSPILYNQLNNHQQIYLAVQLDQLCVNWIASYRTTNTIF